MKKLNIFSAIIMVAGLITSSFVQGQSCDTLRNYDPSSGLSTISINPTNLVVGHWNVNDGVDDYNVTEYAEKYTAPASSNVKAIRFAVTKVLNASGNSNLKLNVYADNNGEPGAIVGSQVVSFDAITAGSWNVVKFDNPVAVNGSFYAGFELSYADYPTDLFQLYTTTVSNGFTQMFTSTIGGGTPGQYEEWDYLGGWVTSGGVPLESAFAFDVLLTNGTTPAPNFGTGGVDEVCFGGSFNVDASSSTGTIDSYNWLTSDDPTTTIYFDDNGTGSEIDEVFPDRATPSAQRLLLLVEGACESKAVFMPITVNPAVDATITTFDDNCSAGQGQIQISATGGDGSYLYSIDGGSTTNPNATFNSLTPGTYNVEVTTYGNGCSYTETVTVGNVAGESISVGPDHTICEGGTATITASGTGNIAWTQGGTPVGTGTSIAVTPTGTGAVVYDATLTDANGCTDTKQVTVTVNALNAATFAYTSNTLCSGGGVEMPTVTNSGGTFTNTGTGLVIDASTGGINTATSTAGTYNVTYTTTGTCPDTKTQSITVTSAADATFTYANADYCQSEGTITPVFQSGSSAGVFSSTTGLSIDGATGAVDLAASTPGTYTVANDIAASGSCSASSGSFSLTVKASPDVVAGSAQDVCEGTSVTLTATGADTYAWDNSVTNGTAFTPAVGSVTYTVTGTSGGCSATDQVVVNVTATPTINAGADDAVCAGENVTLTAVVSAGTVTWDNSVNNGIAFVPTATNTYTATVTDNGCSATDDVTITVNPLPTNVSAGSDQTVCDNDNSFALTGTPSGGTFSGAGVTGNYFDPATAGEGVHTLTYTYSDANSCSATATVDVTVDGCASVDKNALNQFTVSPNPASDYIEVRVDGNNKINNVQLTSLEGKVVPVVYTTIDNQTTQIDVSSVAKGTYFIQLSSENGQLTRKVIVQ